MGSTGAVDGGVALGGVCGGAVAGGRSGVDGVGRLANNGAGHTGVAATVCGRAGGRSAGVRNAGAGDTAVLGDTELGGVLVLAGHIVDELDAVAGGAGGGLEVGGRSPGQATAVGDTLSDGRTELDNVGGRALEEQHRDGVGGAWLPGDGEWLAGGDNLVLLLALMFGGVCAQRNCWCDSTTMQRTSFNGLVMALPLGSPTGTWICAAARLAKRVTMEALVNMVAVLVVLDDYLEDSRIK